MAKAVAYVICYDLSDDREREKVSAALEGYGFRAQKSVFECLLTPGLKRSLMRRLEELELTSGFVSLYRLRQENDRHDVGAPPPRRPGLEPGSYAFVV